MQYTVIQLDGQPYPTRNHPGALVGDTSTRELIDLDDDGHRLSTAHHEAGHAVAYLAIGRAHLISAHIFPETRDQEEQEGQVLTHRGALTVHDLLVAGAAGERAADRWLRHTNQWTQARAVAVEIGASGDRTTLLALPGVTTTTLRAAHNDADTLLTTHWHRVEALAQALLPGQLLTGDQIAAITGLPNPAN